MTTFDVHLPVALGGLVWSPIGGGVLAHLMHVETCSGSPDILTSVSSRPCTDDDDPAAGAVATLIGWAITVTAVEVLEDVSDRSSSSLMTPSTSCPRRCGPRSGRVCGGGQLAHFGHVGLHRRHAAFQVQHAGLDRRRR